MHSVKATLLVKADPHREHFKSRPLTFAVKGQVEMVLQRLEKVGITLGVKQSEHPK